MAFKVPREKLHLIRLIIDSYFDILVREGPAGMRSQCYATRDNDCGFVHIKAFKKESVANQHFRSSPFREYLRKLSELCDGQPLFFSRLEQQKTFESIY